MNLLDNTPNQTSKFKTKNWTEKVDEVHGTDITNSQIKCKTSMLKSSYVCRVISYILPSGIIILPALAAGGGNNNKQAVFKICTQLIDWISETNNARIDNAKDIDAVMSM